MNKIILALMMVFLMVGLCSASDFRLTPPTTLSDSSPIPSSWESMLAYKFHCRIFPNTYTNIQDAGHIEPNAQGDCIYPINLTDGFWYCAATAYFTFDTSLESTYSNEVFFVVSGGAVPSVVPSPPNLGFKK